MKKIKIWVAAILVGCSLMALAAGCAKSPEDQLKDELKNFQNQLENELKNLQ